MASAMYVQKDSLRQVIELGKAHGKKVVVGGPFTSVGADELAAADHIFVGEVEPVFAGFLDDLNHGEARRIYEQAGLTHAMPPANLSYMEQPERDAIVKWFRGAGVVGIEG